MGIYGLFLIMGNAGFISSTAGPRLTALYIYIKNIAQLLLSGGSIQPVGFKVFGLRPRAQCPLIEEYTYKGGGGAAGYK